MPKPLSITDEMPFGKHKGVLVGTLIEEENSYIEWMLDNTDWTLDEEALEYFESQ